MLVKHDFLVRPAFPSQEQTASSMICVGIDIAICSATRADKRRAGQEKTRGGQDPATEFRGAAKRRTKGGQEEDKRRTQSRATEFRGVASEYGQLFFQDRAPTVNCLGKNLSYMI